MKKGIAHYKLFALALRYPDRELVQALSETELFGTALRNVTLEELRHEHFRLFTATVAGGLSLYETEYGHDEIFFKTNQLADIGGFYQAFGIELRETAKERIDFLGTELEFMYWLQIKEEGASKQGHRTEVQICHDAAVKFMTAHLGRWGGGVGELIRRESRLTFYQTVGKELTRFIEEECRRLGALPATIACERPPLSPEAVSSDFTCDFDELAPDEDQVANCLPSYPNSTGGVNS